MTRGRAYTLPRGARLSGARRKFVRVCEGVMASGAKCAVMPRRSADVIELTVEERGALDVIAGRLTAPFREVQRARIVLYAAEGLQNKEIAARLDTAPEVVAKWRRGFCEARLEGLKDKPRTGRPRRFPPGAGRRGQGGRVRAAKEPGRAALALLAR